jgi:hypothetical protein
VQETITELLNTGRVIQVDSLPQVVNPLSVAVQASGKKRLILDLRYVNKCLLKRKVKYEDWRVALPYFEKDAYMFSFDLKSGYHHVAIYNDHQTFLGFAWKDLYIPYRLNTMCLSVLPFGLSTAPYIFTKLIKPLETHWRFQNISIAVFLDDGWSSELDSSKCKTQAKGVRTDLVHAGWIINDEKYIWEPTQVIDWLGLKWNSKEGTLSILERRIDKIQHEI